MLKTNSLTPNILAIVKQKATEPPNSGQYIEPAFMGTYLCRNCGLALFRTAQQFFSGCGWPSFDQAIPNHVELQKDKDGIRTEIVCARCNAHLGHVFFGEGFTPLNIRHCVNSLALDFVTNTHVLDSEEAILAGGCFWGIEYYLHKLAGVIKTEVGYSGGYLENPNYNQVCNGNTGHLEVVRVIYDLQLISYKEILKYFFEIHNPEQINGQGPDLGEQYLSAIFYYDKDQLKVAQGLIKQLTQLGYQVATQLRPVTTFWPAENYHQNYYANKAQTPYCHFYQKKFK